MRQWTWDVLVRGLGLKLLPACAILLGLGCGGGDVTTPTSGSIEITTVTSGPEPDPDGYAVTIDAGAEASIALNGTHRREDLEPGNHSVQLGDLAANCAVTGDNPRTVTVDAGATVRVDFAITCGPTTGSLTITASTSGPSPDADGYNITVDGSDKGTVAANAEITLDGLAPGDHQVGLGGIAANCQAEGDNPQAIELVAGVTGTATFVITCAAPPPITGSLTITTTTSGLLQDPDGYSLALDGGATQSIGVNATLTIPALAAGAHTVALRGLAANCAVDGRNPKKVTLVAGAAASVTFKISCSSAVTHWTSIPLSQEFRWTELWGSSPTDLFVSGAGASTSVIWHYDGQRWSEQLRRNDIAITGIWGSSPTDVFAVSRGLVFGQGVILHYNGTVWSEMAGPTSGRDYGNVWGNSASDVYAFPGVHYDGTSWTWMPESADAQHGFGQGIVAGSSGDLYAFSSKDVSDGDIDCNYCTAYTILHHDGSEWKETFATSGDPSDELNAEFAAIWVSGRNDAWLAAAYLFPYQLYHFDGTKWVGHTSDTVVPEDIWGSSPSNLYAVGNGILHYDGTKWEKINPAEGSRIWGTSPTDVFVLGWDAVLHGTP